MSYPAISLATATVGRHRRPQKRLQTARQPPVYPNSSPDYRACNSLTRFRCPHAVHPCPSVDSGLAYAETGVMPEDLPYESAFAVDSPFQRAVAKRLRERGYEVHDEVATAGKFIDIGIVDPERPGRYIIGIECDGASYHSARSARDRDRLREEVLHGLGWKLHRVWSTDWFRNPERELQRAVEAIERAKTQSPQKGCP